MVESPIDPSIAAIKIELFQSNAIIDAYKKLGIDVSGYFDGIDSVGLYECQKTKYRFFYPHSISGVASLYEHLQQRKGYYRLKNEHEEALRFINRGDSVLEIGCGEGLFIQALRSRHINGQGLEFNELAVEKTRDAGFKWNLAFVFIVLPGVWFGAQYGNQGLAIAMTLISIALVVPGWYVLVRPLCGAGFFEYFQQLLIPLDVSMVAATAAYVAAWPLVDAIARLSVGLAIGGMAYLALSRWLNRQWFDAMWELLFGGKVGT